METQQIEALHTTEPEYASHRVAQLFNPNRIEQVSEGFAMDLRVVRLGPITACRVNFASETRYSVVERPDSYNVSVGLGGPIATKAGRTWLQADAQTAVVYQPDALSTLHGWHDGTEQLVSIKIEHAGLEQALRLVTGRDVVGPVRFEPQMSLRAGVGAQWRQLVSLLVEDLAGPSAPDAAGVGGVFTGDAEPPATWHPLFAARMADALMTGLLVGCRHQHSRLLERDERAARPSAIQRAVEIIETRAHDPLAVSTIAAEVGLSVRALQAGFQEHLGQSPGAFLTQTRLESAHRSLRDGDPQRISAGRVAEARGFGNYGRFAAKYRARYGCTPAHTLAS